nr:MAG TPA: hypothetical protein [Caudoviricetes sp.]
MNTIAQRGNLSRFLYQTEFLAEESKTQNRAI